MPDDRPRELSTHQPRGIYGRKGVFGRGRGRDLERAFPEEPWRWDHAWNDREAASDTLSQAVRALRVSMVLFLLLLPFNWIAFLSGEAQLFFTAGVVLFDAVLLVVLGHGLYLLARRLKYGSSRLVFERFPFFLGDRLECRLVSSRPVSAEGSVSVTLRCVQEEFRYRPNPRKPPKIVCWQLYADEQKIDAEGLRSRGQTDPLVFDLPIGPYTTKLSGHPCRYWEIEVTAATAGVD